MPEVSRFFGMVITMYFEDHEPPHFHARYGSYRVQVGIANGAVEGNFPPRALALVQEWRERHVPGVAGELASCHDWRNAASDRGFGIAMIVWVTRAKYLGGHRLWVEFNDGLSGEVDLEDRLRGSIFEPLRDPEYFAQVTVNEELDTVTWPNGADFAPEFLYRRVMASASEVAEPRPPGS